MTSSVTRAPKLKTATVSVLHSDFTAGAASETINIWSIPVGCQVTGVVVRVIETPDDSDATMTNWSLEFGTSVGADVDAFLTSHDYIADAPEVFESTRGVALTTSQGMYSSTAATNLTATATVVAVTLDDADIDAGQWEVYISYIQHAYS